MRAARRAAAAVSMLGRRSPAPFDLKSSRLVRAWSGQPSGSVQAGGRATMVASRVLAAVLCCLAIAHGE